MRKVNLVRCSLSAVVTFGGALLLDSAPALADEPFACDERQRKYALEVGYEVCGADSDGYVIAECTGYSIEIVEINCG